MKRPRPGLGVIVLLAVMVAGCGGDDGGTTAPIVTITNSWADVSDAAHTFDLLSNDDGQTQGTFTGTETLPDQSTFDLAGSWADGEVRFTVQRSSPVTYLATVTSENPLRLTFHSSAGDLTIERQ